MYSDSFSSSLLRSSNRFLKTWTNIPRSTLLVSGKSYSSFMSTKQNPIHKTSLDLKRNTQGKLTFGSNRRQILRKENFKKNAPILFSIPICLCCCCAGSDSIIQFIEKMVFMMNIHEFWFFLGFDLRNDERGINLCL